MQRPRDTSVPGRIDTFCRVQVHGCMVYTEHASKGQQFHVATAMQQLNSAVIISVAIQNALCKAAVTHSESYTTRAQLVCSEAQNRAIQFLL